MFEIALALIPLFVLVGSLLFGHYPGFETIVRISKRLSSQPRLRGAKCQARPRAPQGQAIRGGLLLAFGFAQRPPPFAPLPR
ncbi:MAG TPA: hypothetical protein VJQ84_05400 [Solirubrobacterales bacterium]|nr:hypothetical protein [Solirubrobacterales bacterium]